MRIELFFLLLSVMLMSSIGICETVIEDGAEVSGTWTEQDSPYIINGEAIVPENTTLIIEPGVEVRFSTGTIFNFSNAGFDAAYMRVNGKLVAQGDESNMITFTRDGDTDEWGLILFNTDNTENVISYCNIEYGHWIDNLIPEMDFFYGTISFYQSIGTLNNNILSNNAGAGIAGYSNSNVTIEDNYISNNTYGVSTENSLAIITNNNVSDNSSYGLSFEDCTDGIAENNTITGNEAAGIELNGSDVTILNNILDGNVVGGIYSIFNDNSFIINNRITNTGRGIYCGYSSSPQIIGNAIVHNINAMYCSGGSSPTITNNTISYSSDVGILCDGATLDIANTILYANSAAAINSTSSVIISHSLVQGEVIGSITYLEGNIIDGDPLFVDGLNGDFQLTDESPCINTGDNDVANLPDYDIAGNLRIFETTIDMGAYERSEAASIDPGQGLMVSEFKLQQNYPNPFNPTTTINYELIAANSINLVVFNAKGESVWQTGEKRMKPGSYAVQFDGSGLNSGIYFYSLKIGGVVKQTRKMMLVK